MWGSLELLEGFWNALWVVFGLLLEFLIGCWIAFGKGLERFLNGWWPVFGMDRGLFFRCFLDMWE